MRIFRTRPARMVALVAASFCVISFQNCTLHQSEGRKYLESMDPTVAVMGNCLPLLSATSLSSAYGNVTPEVTLANLDFLFPDSGGVLISQEKVKGCLVYTASPNVTGAESMRCAIRTTPAFTAVAGQALPASSIYGWQGTTQWRSFGNPPAVTYRIEGQQSVTNQWASCDFTFNVAEPNMNAAEKASAQQRGQTAVIQMLLNN